jgi:hypothetical protein
VVDGAGPRHHELPDLRRPRRHNAIERSDDDAEALEILKALDVGPCTAVGCFGRRDVRLLASYQARY